MVFQWLLAFAVDYWRVWLGLFVANAVLGVILFEFAWYKIKRIRCGEEALFQEFPSYRRLDMHNWSRSKFYPGCMLLIIPRLALILWAFY